MQLENAVVDSDCMSGVTTPAVPGRDIGLSGVSVQDAAFAFTPP
ncbi:MAG: hypothetical protein ABSB41_06815 [Anaerolineales bacterium]|jgi:hypothetical protein